MLSEFWRAASSGRSCPRPKHTRRMLKKRVRIKSELRGFAPETTYRVDCASLKIFSAQHLKTSHQGSARTSLAMIFKYRAAHARPCAPNSLDISASSRHSAWRARRALSLCTEDYDSRY